MKKIITCYLSLMLLMLSVQNISVAQVPSFVWAKSVTATTFGVSGESMAVDASGNFYIAGDFLGTVDFDPGPGVYNITSFESCCNDIFVLKLDPSGGFLWAKQIGGLNFDRCEGMCIDASGNVILTGTFGGTPDFDPGPGVFTLSAANYFNMFIAKLDASGNFVFAKHINGTGLYSDAGDITTDVAGNIYTTGYFSDTCDFEPGPGVYQLYADTTGGLGQHGTIFVSRFDPAGNIIWAKSLGNMSSFNAGRGIAVDAGMVYITGRFGGTGDFDPGAGTYNMTAEGVGPNETNVFICKLNVAGNFIWAKRMGNESSDGNVIKIGSTGNVYTAGSFYLTADFDPGSGTAYLTSNGNDDIFISALDVTGNFLWAKGMGGTGNEQALSLTIDSYDNIYTTGVLNSSFDADPGPGTLMLFPTSQGFISKLDRMGNFLNAGPTGGGGLSLAADTPGNVYISGAFSGTRDFDPGPAIVSMSTSANVGLFLSKLCTTPAAPVNTTNPANLSVCSDNTTTLTATSTGTVNWYSSPTSTLVLGSGANFITPTLTVGSFTYYAEANACSVNAERTPFVITANGCTGIRQLYDTDAEISIFPNPNNGEFAITLNSFSETTTIEMYNLLGSLVFKAKVRGSKTQVNLSHLAHGIYQLRVLEKERIVKQIKVIKAVD